MIAAWRCTSRVQACAALNCSGEMPPGSFLSACQRRCSTPSVKPASASLAYLPAKRGSKPAARNSRARTASVSGSIASGAPRDFPLASRRTFGFRLRPVLIRHASLDFDCIVSSWPAFWQPLASCFLSVMTTTPLTSLSLAGHALLPVARPDGKPVPTFPGRALLPVARPDGKPVSTFPGRAPKHSFPAADRRRSPR